MPESLTKVLRLAEQMCAVHRSGKRVRPAMWAALEGHLRAARSELAQDRSEAQALMLYGMLPEYSADDSIILWNDLPELKKEVYRNRASLVVNAALVAI